MIGKAKSNQTITVFGAYGHTGRFVVSELCKRGWTPILSGRDSDKLNAFGDAHPELEVRVASIDDPASLDRAISGAAAIINCAGPFALTSTPVIEAALRAKIPYLDITGEVEVAGADVEQYATRARNAGIVIIPAMAFFGGLGDLLATAAMGDWSAADEVCVAFALSSSKPTLGTRATIRSSTQRRGGGRVVFSNHRMALRTGSVPILDWTFHAAFGTQTVMEEFTTADIATISRHLRTPEIRTYITLAPLQDLDDPDLSPPVAVDESGRSSQIFLVEAIVRLGSAERRAVASGRDMYAITAPIVVEAVERILDGRFFKRSGVAAAGEIFDARDFLESLSPEHLSVEIQ